jgi:hypothetical protein
LAEIGSRLSLKHPAFHLEGVRIDTLLAWDGGGAAQLRFPAIEWPATDEAPGLRSAVCTGELRFGPAGASTGRFDLPSLEVLGADGAAVLLLRDLHAAHSTAPWLPGIMVGAGEFTVSAALGFSENASFEAEDLAIGFEAHPEDGLLGVSLSSGVGGLHLGEADYGPSQVEFSASRLDGPTLSALQEDMVELNTQGVPEAMAGIAVAGVLMKHLPALVAAEPRLAIDRLDVSTPGGPIQGRLSIGVKGLTGIDLLAGAWLDRLVAEGELSLPRELAMAVMVQAQQERLLEKAAAEGTEGEGPAAGQEQALEVVAAAQLDVLVQGGWVKADDGRLTSVLKLVDGVLSVNGKTLPLAEAMAF